MTIKDFFGIFSAEPHRIYPQPSLRDKKLYNPAVEPIPDIIEFESVAE